MRYEPTHRAQSHPYAPANLTRGSRAAFGQHSDARVLEQSIYKWKHARRQIAEALFVSYEQLLHNRRAVTREEISRDVSRLFSGNLRNGLQLVEKKANTCL